MFKRRLGQNVMQCSGGHNCAQILEMSDHDFAVAGQNITDEAVAMLPPGPGIGPDERIVKVPREVMLSAMADFLVTV